MAELGEKFPDRAKEIVDACDYLVRTRVRLAILDDDKRIDDRKSTDIRQISADVQVLPRTHGSALFTRGETQALATVTLGTSSDEQKIDALLGERFKKFHAALQLPAVLDRRGEVAARAVAARNRPRRARRARARRRCSPTKTTSRTRFASCRTCSSPTAARRWRRCAAAPSR